MLSRLLFLLLFAILPTRLLAQEVTYAAIPENLKLNADAVVRQNQVEVNIEARDKATVRRHRIVTVLNEKGLSDVGAFEYFDKSTSVRSIEAQLYNASGELIKKFKRKDFREELLAHQADVTDNKIISLQFLPTQYPLTIVYTSESTTSNTAWLPQWLPLEGLYVSTQHSTFHVSCVPGLGFKYKEFNFNGFSPVKVVTDNSVSYSVDNLAAVRGEDRSPSFMKLHPYVRIALDKFHLEGVDGEATNWAAFGAWIYNSLLAGTDELSPETVKKMKDLTAGETDPLKKAKLVYEYMQSKTRYISIQLGIGGWQPMKAKDVDRLGYGDCKALSNYMRCLLAAVGVESYYTVIYGDNSKADLQADFVSLQGNHVILTIPGAKPGEYTWLECTSQQAPFGFQGDFTDDRTALLVKPGGGELVRTKVYDARGNLQATKGAFTITETGAISGNIVINSYGTQYDRKYPIETRPYDDIINYYKSAFSIGNLKVKKAAVKNAKDIQQFTEDVAIDAEAYCSKSGNRMFFTANAFNQSNDIPPRYRDRKNPLQIERGWYDTDEVVITLPQGYAIEAKPENVAVTDKFGEYKAEYNIDKDGKLIYRRSMLLNSGLYTSADYELYRQFREKVAKNDNAKVVLIKI